MRGGHSPDTDGRYYWLDPKVTKKSRLNTWLLRAKTPLSPAKLASLKQRRLLPLRLHPPLDARPLRPFLESAAFSWDCRYRLLYKYSYQYQQSPKPPQLLFCRLLQQTV